MTLREPDQRLAEVLAALSPAKRRLAARLLNSRGVPLIAGPVGESIEAASSAERGLWFIEQTGTHAAYNEAVTVRLRGRLDPPALVESLHEIVRRHSALRRSFELVNGRLTRRTRQEIPVQVERQSWLHASEAEVERALAERAERAFDLSAGPLFRVGLFERGENDWLLQSVVHHIVCDRWSLGIFHRELSTCYQSLLERQQLPPLEAPRAIHAGRPLEQLSPEQIEKRRSWWRERLVLNSDADRPSPVLPGISSATTLLPPELTTEIEALARAEHTTPFVVLLSAFQRALRRTGIPDSVIGTDLSGRDRAGSEGEIGLWVNQLALPLESAAAAPGTVRLKRLHALLLEARAHELPYADVLNALALSPAASLFHAKFVYHFPQFPLELLGLSVEVVELEAQHAKFELLVDIEPQIRPLRDEPQPGTELRVTARARGADRLDLVTELVAAFGDALRVPRRRGVLLRTRELATFAPLVEGRRPLVCRPALSGVDTIAWVSAEREDLLSRLTSVGAVLLRGFSVGSPERLRALMLALFGDTLPYTDRTTPRRAIGEGVFSSTEYASDRAIPLHNESSYSNVWPLWLAFHCVCPARAGGRTPIADCRRVLARLGSRLRDRFEKRGLLYVRRFGRLGLGWREAFQVEEQPQLEQELKRLGYAWEWRDGVLSISRSLEATARHPRTGELSWFNHALFYDQLTLRESLGSDASWLRREDHPIRILHMDGSPIDDESIAELRAAYAAETLSIAWQAEDVLLIDNMACAHGREPFKGPREVRVSLSNAVRGGAE